MRLFVAFSAVRNKLSAINYIGQNTVIYVLIQPMVSLRSALREEPGQGGLPTSAWLLTEGTTQRMANSTPSLDLRTAESEMELTSQGIDAYVELSWELFWLSFDLNHQ